MSDPSPTSPRARDFDPGVLRLFDQYVHGQIDRRQFLDQAARYAVGGLTAVGLLEALSPRFAQARQVAPDDARVAGRFVELPSPQGHGTLRGYLVQPAADAGPRPSVLVIHENRGLNPHIEDVARRLALAGYNAFAPDALFPLGGYPGDEDRARELFPRLDQTKTFEDFIAAAAYLQALPQGNGRVGAVGFCYGGGVANRLAARLPDLDAAVPFYGPAPTLDTVASIKAPLQIHFAETDERINAGWPAYEAALQRAGVRHEAHHYPGTQHGFHNDTTPRHDAAAARLAWDRTLAFFRQHLHR